MKDDREFLDGIYQKAAEYKPVPIKRRISIRAVSGMAACFLICVLCLGVFAMQRSLKDNGERGENRTRNLDVNTQNTEVANYEPATVDEQPRAWLFNITPDVIVSGTVEELYTEEGNSYVKLLIKEMHYGTEQVEELIVSNSYAAEDGSPVQAMNIDEIVLLLLNAQGDGTYILSGGRSGKYTYVSGDGGDAMYQGIDGISYTLEEIISGKLPSDG